MLQPGRRFRTAALYLFPLALIGGFALMVANYPPPAVQTTIDKNQAVRIARDFAEQQGIHVQTWSSKTAYSADSSNLNFVNARRERLPLWRIAPPLSALVTLKAPTGNESLVVFLSVDGRVVGFDWSTPTVPRIEIPEAEARQAAKRQMAGLPASFHFGEPSLTAKGNERTWVFRSASVRDTDIRATVKTVGDRATSLRVKAQASDDADNSEGTTQTVLTVAGAAFICLIAIYSIYRYVSRTMQQEVSHRRSVLVALLCGGFCVVIGGNAVVNSSTGDVPLTFLLIVFAILGLLGGSLLAAAYGSGEGDIREAYPGKLTSLDALLSGHIFSRNVGTSVLFGIAFSGWLTLVLGVAGIFFRTNDPQGSEELVAPFMQMRALMPLFIYPLLSLAFGAAGLLQPLAFLERYAGRLKRFHIPILVVCAGLVSTLRLHNRSTAEFLVVCGVIVTALLAPFFQLDLLASIVCVTALTSHLGSVGYMASAPSLSNLSLVIHWVALTFFTVLAIASVRNGKTYTEEQVRPLYARHIAERKSLEAEVSAAREAQLRLLPESTPDFPGLSISAVCLPAETVGGDFYDFFPLGDGRLGVFIAEGNRGGLGAALTIALAKGYLMHSVGRSGEPVEILSRLESALGSIFNPEAWGEAEAAPAPTEFAFAAIDTSAGEIRYARTAAYPKIVVVSARGAMPQEKMVAVAGRGAPIAEGSASFGEGDQLLLFTDGIGRRLATGNRRPDDVATELARAAKDTEHLSHALLDYSKHQGEPDDLTLVVIRRVARALGEQDASLEGVA